MPAEQRALPVTVALEPGEALDGYLERVAAANHLPTSTLHGMIRSRAATRFLMLRPAADLVATLNQLLGLTPSQVTASTLECFDGTALDLRDLTAADRYTYRHVAARGWAAAHGSQICPKCLADQGIWKVRWRTPYSAICVNHGTYLLVRCPGCDRPFRDQHHSPLRAVGAAATCGNPTANRRRHSQCEIDLAVLPTVDARQSEIAAQARIDAALNGSDIVMLSEPVDPTDYLRELRALANLLWHLAAQPRVHPCDEPAWITATQRAAQHRTGQRGPRWAMRPPDDPIARAGGLAAADTVLTDPDITAASDRLTPWLECAPAVSEGALGWLADRTQMTAQLSRLVVTSRAPHRRLSHLLDNAPQLRPVAFVPQVIPEPIFQRHLCTLFHSSPATVRLFAAICLARAADGVTSWAEAGTALGLPPELAVRTARACSARARRPPSEIVAALNVVAGDLPRNHYRAMETKVQSLRRRRTWFENFKNSRPGTRPTSRIYAITWLWDHVAYGLMGTSPAWSEQPSLRQRNSYRQFAESLKPQHVHVLQTALR